MLVEYRFSFIKLDNFLLSHIKQEPTQTFQNDRPQCKGIKFNILSLIRVEIKHKMHFYD